MVVYILNKDISYDAKVNKSKISNFGVKYSNSALKGLFFLMMFPRFLSTV